MPGRESTPETSMGYIRRDYTLPLAATLMLSTPISATEQQDLDWLENDFEAQALAVNEGELTFLSEPPDKPVHHHVNHIRITEASLRNGWTVLEQCHSHLDAVADAQIAYRPGRVRALQILSVKNIDKAWVEGSTVQLREVQPGARICIRAESRTLTDLGDGLFSLRNGPFMRRFLDGYYPMRVSMTIGLDEATLRVVRVTPAAQEGFRVWQDKGEFHFDAWFEGMLYTEVVLERRGT
jgi:hypothetical protein